MGGCCGEEGMSSVRFRFSLGRGGCNELYMVQDGCFGLFVGCFALLLVLVRVILFFGVDPIKSAEPRELPPVLNIFTGSRTVQRERSIGAYQAVVEVFKDGIATLEAG